jgi:hypothetical protein
MWWGHQVVALLPAGVRVMCPQQLAASSRRCCWCQMMLVCCGLLLNWHTMMPHGWMRRQQVRAAAVLLNCPNVSGI